MNRRDYAIANRVRPVDLTPWAAAVAGDLSAVDLPRGYWIDGSAKSAAGPFRLALHRPGLPSELSRDRIVIEQWVTAGADVPTWLQVLSDLAAIDERERGRYIVTVGPGDYIEGIEDA